jgi:hypothetical protein
VRRSTSFESCVPSSLRFPILDYCFRSQVFKSTSIPILSLVTSVPSVYYHVRVSTRVWLIQSVLPIESLGKIQTFPMIEVMNEEMVKHKYPQ